MNAPRIERFGTDYGGWMICPDLIPQSGTIVDAGVGTDISFPEELLKVRPDVRFIGVDHMQEAEQYVARRGIQNYHFIRAAIAPATGTTTMYRADGHSESVCKDNRLINPNAPYEVAAISIEDLIRRYNPCLIKIDIEGSEYGVYRQCFGVQQVCIEFHHWLIPSFTENDTEKAIKDFEAHGYHLAHRTKSNEVLLVLR